MEFSARSADPEVRALLAAHPKVRSVDVGGAPGVELFQTGKQRRVLVGVASCPLRGIVELMDNNPLVCADEMSVPTPAATLALIALGPLAEAGLILEPPAFLTNLPATEEELDGFLASVSWAGGVTLQVESKELKGVGAATAIAAIPTTDDPSDLDALYDERYSRSFFVRRDEESEWDVRLVSGTQHACYRLGITPGEGQSLLRVQVMADLRGKCGAGQVVHAMNVMCGFEESLGLA